MLHLPPELKGRVIAFSGLSRRKRTFDKISLDDSKKVWGYCKDTEREMDSMNTPLIERTRLALTRLRQYVEDKEGQPNAYDEFAGEINNMERDHSFCPKRLLAAWPRNWDDSMWDDDDDILEMERELLIIDQTLVDAVFPDEEDWAPSEKPDVSVEVHEMLVRSVTVKLGQLQRIGKSDVDVQMKLTECVLLSGDWYDLKRETCFTLIAYDGDDTMTVWMTLKQSRGTFVLEVYPAIDDHKKWNTELDEAFVDLIVPFLRVLGALDEGVPPLSVRLKTPILTRKEWKQAMRRRSEREGWARLGFFVAVDD